MILTWINLLTSTSTSSVTLCPELLVLDEFIIVLNPIFSDIPKLFIMLAANAVAFYNNNYYYYYLNKMIFEVDGINVEEMKTYVEIVSSIRRDFIRTVNKFFGRSSPQSNVNFSQTHRFCKINFVFCRNNRRLCGKTKIKNLNTILIEFLFINKKGKELTWPNDPPLGTIVTLSNWPISSLK